MEAERHLELFAADHARMVAACRDLAARPGGLAAAPVPSCPGWSAADLVEHTAFVYDHKTAALHAGGPPSPWPPDPPAGDPVDWLERAYAGLAAELIARGPKAAAWTWHPPEQTVRFWDRRMAQETAVHRIDAEQAAGGTSAVDTELALDGIDEMVDVVIGGDWSFNPQPGPERSVVLAAGGRTWVLGLAAEYLSVDHDPPTADGPDRVTAEPAELFLWLWGRAPDTAVEVTGDPAGAAAVRSRAAEVTG